MNPPRNTRKQTWHFPSRAECMVCHSRAANFVLGLSEVQMNKDHDYGGAHDNQLRELEHLGVLRVNWADYERERAKHDGGAALSEQARGQRESSISSLLPRTPERMRKLADPYDPVESLEARSRSYLQANCAHCHVESGGGNAQFDVEFLTSRDGMNLINVPPQHSTFGLPDARLIAPGVPERSVLLHRVSHRGEGHMPPMATSLVDESAVQMLRDWIATMKQ